MEFSAEQIAQFLRGEIEGNPQEKVNNISRIEEGGKGTLSFLANLKYEKYLYSTTASIVLVNKSLALSQPVTSTLIRVDDAYQAFASLLNLVQGTVPRKKGIDPGSFIAESASVGKDCYVGMFAFIGENVKIGDSVCIYPQVYVGDNVSIGDNTILYPGVKIYHDCQLGKNCIIHSSTVIGSDGFGFAPGEETFQKIPQLGNVIIEDDVEIGSNVSIDRATIGSTILHKGTKLDNLIQIAHNVEVGENTVIVAQAGIAGSTKIGRNVMIGAQAGIIGHIILADKVKIGAQAGVANSVKQEGVILLGAPAFDIRDAKKSMILFRRLPQMYDQINKLEKEIELLKNQLTDKG
ncbi:MAG: UDP-3-O-(3-hydroxymyristoyl)glucosamine N-acyltransferase [Bacteroidales bacterium]|nr:UDP-3-O-(3-hydroxymyristoyl)glucosamine N-acyltransferase [Bacteroidales bacterium]